MRNPGWFSRLIARLLPRSVKLAATIQLGASLPDANVSAFRDIVRTMAGNAAIDF